MKRRLVTVLILAGGVWFWRYCGGAIFCPQGVAEPGWLLSDFI